MKSARLLQWVFLFFFRQITDFTLHVQLFSTDFNRFTRNPVVTGSSSCLSQKLFRAFAKADESEWFPFSIFFLHCATFFGFLPSRVPFNCFLILCNKLDFQKTQRASSFTFFGTMRLFQFVIFRLKFGFFSIYPEIYFFSLLSEFLKQYPE